VHDLADPAETVYQQCVTRHAIASEAVDGRM